MAVLKVRLTPRGGRSELMRWEEGILYARVAAPPVEGAANEALVRLLSDALGVRKSAIIITSGATSRVKLLEFKGMDERDLEARVAAALEGRRA